MDEKTIMQIKAAASIHLDNLVYTLANKFSVTPEEVGRLVLEVVQSDMVRES